MEERRGERREERGVLAGGVTRRPQGPQSAPLPSPRGLVQRVISAVRETGLEIPIPQRRYFLSSLRMYSRNSSSRRLCLNASLCSGVGLG